MLRLKDKYIKEVIPQMMKEFGYKNPMAVPKIEKIMVNSSFGQAVTGKSSSEREKIVKNISDVLELITGQKPVLTKAKKSISTFKLRQGAPIGFKITLRKKRMYDFLERLIFIALPRTRDFRGISLKSIDRQGNLTLGFKDYSLFPEVILEKEKGVFGLEITIITNTNDKEKGIELLRRMGIPLKREL